MQKEDRSEIHIGIPRERGFGGMLTCDKHPKGKVTREAKEPLLFALLGMNLHIGNGIVA